MLEKKLLRATVILTLMLAVSSLFTLYYMEDILLAVQKKQIEFAHRSEEKISLLKLIRQENVLLDSKEASNVLKKQLRFELPEHLSQKDVSFENDYLHHIVMVHIPKVSERYFYQYPIVGNCDHIDEITYELTEDGMDLMIFLDQVYEIDTEVEEDYIYMDFVNPRELYDKIVVVDAGHGGKDDGAAKQGVKEKDLDLAIVQQIEACYQEEKDQLGYRLGIYYTREEDKKVSLEDRARLANDLQADLFLSVHNNSTASGRMSDISGTEVMYRVTDESGASKRFAEICLHHLLGALGTENKGLVAGDDIYIIRTAQMPVALAEVGFMTNAQELARMSTPEFQEQSGQALFHAMKQMLEEMNE